MHSYHPPTAQKHETILQDRRRELRTEDQKLAELKKALQAKIGTGSKNAQDIRAA